MAKHDTMSGCFRFLLLLCTVLPHPRQPTLRHHQPAPKLSKKNGRDDEECLRTLLARSGKDTQKKPTALPAYAREGFGRAMGEAVGDANVKETLVIYP